MKQANSVQVRAIHTLKKELYDTYECSDLPEVRNAFALGVQYGVEAVSAFLGMDTLKFEIEHQSAGVTNAAVMTPNDVWLGTAVLSKADMVNNWGTVSVGRAIALLRALRNDVPPFLLGKE